MKILITGLRELSVVTDSQEPQNIPENWHILNIAHCAVCRTDAKIWSQGHRDLYLPRVPGHEIVARKDTKRYVVWPGIVCGNCRYCTTGRENLCDSIKILGFHLDGGFSDTITVPISNCIPIPECCSSYAAAFAEPAGCIVNAFRKVGLQKDDRLLIFGAGTIGLLASILALHFKVRPIIIEKNEFKILKAGQFSQKYGVPICKSTIESKYDVILNACSDPIAFLSAIPKTSKGARIAFFSGLEKNMQMESNLLNLVHYKELNICGSYGLTREDMKTGLDLICKDPQAIEALIEDVVSPEKIYDVLPRVLEGNCYKYVLDFSGNGHKASKVVLESKACEKSKRRPDHKLSFFMDIPEQTESIGAQAQQKIDNKTKPLGALGTLESLAVKMCLIQNTLTPGIRRKAIFVFAADHGIAEEGVSAFPQEVTRQMVQNFLEGGAAINVLSRHGDLDLRVVDIGVKGPVIVNPGLITKRIAFGTKNFAIEPAMTFKEVESALVVGADVFNTEYASGKIDILGLGEMGIANTTAATAIISTITGVPVAECTGRGTGIDDQGLEHKIKILEKALAFHKPDRNDIFDILCKIGGLEIAGIAGAALAAASKRCAIVLDGLISTAAGLVAYTIEPAIVNYFIAGHKSVEIGHQAALHNMGLTPVLDLNMRLGEGTGAALTINLVDSGCRIMCEMASFEKAGVSGKK